MTGDRLPPFCTTTPWQALPPWDEPEGVLPVP